MTKASKPRLWLTAAVLGSVVALFLCFAGGLSPLAAADRPALALFALCAAFPVGAMLGRLETTRRAAGARAAAGLVGGLALALVVSLPDPALAVRTASWCAAAALLGCALAGLGRGLGMAALLAWLGLCGLPFFCGSLGTWRQAAESVALAACPWLGFSADALGGDPLRRQVIYLGQWSSLGDEPATGLLQAWQLWVAAALALVAALVRPALGARPALPAEEGRAIVSPESGRDHDRAASQT